MPTQSHCKEVGNPFGVSAPSHWEQFLHIYCFGPAQWMLQNRSSAAQNPSARSLAAPCQGEKDGAEQQRDPGQGE